MACRDEATSEDFKSGDHGHGHGHGHGHSHGGGHDHKHEEEDNDGTMLWAVIDIDKVRCLNESRREACKSVFKTWEERLNRDKVRGCVVLCASASGCRWCEAGVAVRVPLTCP